jgi:hypothetical protein
MKKYGFLIPFLLFFLSACAPNDMSSTIKEVNQNVLSYLNPETENEYLINPEKQAILMENYLKRYFSPWEDNSLSQADKNEIKASIYKILIRFKKHPGWAQTHQPHSTEWVRSIEENMNLENLFQHREKAINVVHAYIRLLPTHSTSYSNFKKAGQGLFDNLQNTLLPANTPLLVIHKTENKAWSLVVSPYAFGWMRSTQIATVDKAFIQTWKTGEYVTPAALTVSLKTDKTFLFTFRLGQLLPSIPEKQDEKSYTVLTARKKLNGQAIIEQVKVDKKLVYKMPVPLTPYNIALIANEMVGKPFGCRGLFGNRDGSSTLMDLFAPFGIWIPRNASEQISIWKSIPIEKLSKNEKEKMIKEKGIPMLTAISWPSHTLLYLGTHNGKIYTYHTTWGLTTTLITGKTGRAIFGKTVVTPIDIGSNFMNIKSTLLDKAKFIIFLGKS